MQNALVIGLLRIAAAIGRWILDLAARRGGEWLGQYLEERIRVFRTRLRRTTRAARVEWLKGRIARWLTAATWLKKNASTVDDDVVELVCKLPAAKKLPLVAVCDREAA